MRKRSSAVSRTFTALPTSWLWPAGPPIWQMSALGAVVALSAAAVPALPTVLPDKPPSSPAPAVAGPETGHQDRPSKSPKAVPTSEVSATPSATSVPTVSAVVPSQKPGETPSEAPPATASETPAETASPTDTPATPVDPGETGAPAQPVDTSVTIVATDSGNQRWLVTGTTCDTCASGSRIIGIGLLATLTVPVDVDADGTRQLTIAYESAVPRDLYISVNGALPKRLPLAATGGWKQPGWTSTGVELKSGANTLTFSNPLGLAPDLDQFTIS